MIRAVRFFTLIVLLVAAVNLSAQKKRVVYHPCFLMDSVDKHLDFIKVNAGRVFVDSFDCKQTLLDSIANRYVKTKNVKYLDALSVIRQNPNARVEDLYTDIIKRIIENDFGGFIQQLYLAKGRLAPLQNELIATLNMIVGTQPLKQKYYGQLNVEMIKAKEAKDKYKEYYLDKLKLKIDEEKYR